MASIVRRLSTATVAPKVFSPPLAALELTPFDVALLHLMYVQAGLLFAVPAGVSPAAALENIRTALAGALREFFPLAGRLGITNHGDGVAVRVDCNNAGAEFVHAVAAGVTVADVFTINTDVPSIVESFFPADDALNSDGHRLPLLSVQVTELDDGIFVGCSFNHALGDGTTFWSFFNSWAEIARRGALSTPPVFDRSLSGGVYGALPVKLPLSFPGEADRIRSNSQSFLRSQPTREIVFHFSSASMAALKEESGIPTRFQALCALIWRCVTRARRLPPEAPTRCIFPVGDRGRIIPPVPEAYFGNCFHDGSATAMAGELCADQGRRRGAMLIGAVVGAVTDAVIRRAVAAQAVSPVIFTLPEFFTESNIFISCSARFDVYGCDFGFGKPAAVRSGAPKKSDGKVSLYPGWEGAGSVDAQIRLVPETMGRLLEDEEFMMAVSPPAPELLAAVSRA